MNENNSNFEKFQYNDFTEKNYKNLILKTKKFYKFSSFNDNEKKPHVIWRHDVDFSVHRALRLAKIEEELNVKTTYFFHLHSLFYNIFEKEILDKIFQIIKLGHHIGLHYEPSFYSNNLSKKEFLKTLKFEKNILQELFNKKIEVFSFHNPQKKILTTFNQNTILNMKNAYGEKMLKYQYVSDSNGYWRFNRLEDILKKHESKKLHVLIHPEWWQKKPMSPKEKVLRCINFRGKNTEKNYDLILKKLKRKNIS